MRWDMYEVIIERPRGGYRLRARDGRERMRARTDPESAPLHERISMSRGSKYLNENLAPLRRFLQSRVGRLWNKVHSEICEHLRLQSAVQKHVLDHLRDMVHIRVVRHGDVLLEHGRWGARELRTSRWSPFYVCPDTEELKRIP